MLQSFSVPYEQVVPMQHAPCGSPPPPGTSVSINCAPEPVGSSHELKLLLALPLQARSSDRP